MHFNPRISTCVFARAALSAALCMLISSPCWAEDQPVFALQWTRGQGAADCPDQEKLAREVAARLGRDPFVYNAPKRIVGSIERHNGFFSLKLDEQGPVGHTTPLTQTSSATNCDAIFAYAVVAVSMIIAPESVNSSISITPPVTHEFCTPCAAALPVLPPSPAEKPIPPAPPPGASPVIQVLHPPPPVRLSAFIQGSILQGFLPGITPQWGVEVRAGRHRFEASLGLFQSASHLSSNGAFAFQTQAGSLGLCVRTLNLAPISMWGCVHAWLGVITLDLVDTSNFSLAKSGPFPWFGASFAPRLQLPLPKSLLIEGGTHILINMPPRKFTGEADQSKPFDIYTQNRVNIAPFVSLGISIL